jgi:hypothetical protein
MKIKLWIAKKLLSLIRIEWRIEPIQNVPEIKVMFADTQKILLRARYNFRTDRYEFEEYQ